jgi:hypothetical protein
VRKVKERSGTGGAAGGAQEEEEEEEEELWSDDDDELSKHLYGVDQWWVLLKNKTKTLIATVSCPCLNRNSLACLL